MTNIKEALRIARGYIADDVTRKPSEYDPRADLRAIDAALAQLDGADAVSSTTLARDWKTIEEQIASATPTELFSLFRDYLVMNSTSGDDLAPLYIARITAILSTGLLPDASPGNGAEKVREALEVAYGLLWVVGCDRSTLGGNALYLARKALLEQLDKAGQARGITAARKALNDEDAAHGLRYSLHGYSDPSVRSRSCGGAGDASTGGTSSGSVAAVRDDGNTAGPTRADGLNAALHSTSAAGETTSSDGGGCMADFSSGDPNNLKELMAGPSVFDPPSEAADVLAMKEACKRAVSECLNQYGRMTFVTEKGWSGLESQILAVIDKLSPEVKAPASPPDVEAIGFAVMSFGKINVTTVSPTRRGALVNWLVSSARIPVFQWTTDDEIESSWRQLSGRDHKCAEVSIAALLDGGRKP